MAIGPTFGKELEQAGLSGLSFAWSDDGTLNYSKEITPEQKAAIEAVLAAHNPNNQLPASPSVEGMQQQLAAMQEQLAALLNNQNQPES